LFAADKNGSTWGSALPPAKQKACQIEKETLLFSNGYI
jgi:hypothetical protein